jgi:hypothetical protein
MNINININIYILFRLSSTFFFTITMASLMLTACSDPGIVRITPISEKEETEEEIENTMYCEICSIYQPERLHIRHCQVVIVFFRSICF